MKHQMAHTSKWEGMFYTLNGLIIASALACSTSRAMDRLTPAYMAGLQDVSASYQLYNGTIQDFHDAVYPIPPTGTGMPVSFYRYYLGSWGELAQLEEHGVLEFDVPTLSNLGAATLVLEKVFQRESLLGSYAAYLPPWWEAGLFPVGAYEAHPGQTGADLLDVNKQLAGLLIVDTEKQTETLTLDVTDVVRTFAGKRLALMISCPTTPLLSLPLETPWSPLSTLDWLILQDFWIATPAQGGEPRIELLLAQDFLQNLEAQLGDLFPSDTHSAALAATLAVPLKALADSNPNNDSAGKHAVSAFINKVEAQRGKSIAPADADQLIAIAQQILALSNP